MMNVVKEVHWVLITLRELYIKQVCWNLTRFPSKGDHICGIYDVDDLFLVNYPDTWSLMKYFIFLDSVADLYMPS